jgi:hypothetical protein
MGLLIDFTIALGVNFLIGIGATIGAFALGYAFIRLKRIQIGVIQWLLNIWQGFTLSMPGFVLLFVLMFIASWLAQNISPETIPSPIVITIITLAIGLSAAVMDYLVKFENERSSSGNHVAMSEVFTRVYLFAFSGSGMGAAIGTPDSVRFVLNLSNTLPDPGSRAWLMFGFCLFLAAVVYGVNQALHQLPRLVKKMRGALSPNQ